ncbi:hypothetical protein Tco_1043832 [Tanacetum coccineum]|uniref:Zinc knuckle CX2CX4HX4C n=1 Tax=Tanacetum coccineum TaxID=301880 RepID=A0ABQ5GQD3_9ASTR
MVSERSDPQTEDKKALPLLNQIFVAASKDLLLLAKFSSSWIEEFRSNCKRVLDRKRGQGKVRLWKSISLGCKTPTESIEDGSMIISAIQAAVSRFSNNNECTVFLTRLKAVGIALNLTVASHTDDDTPLEKDGAVPAVDATPNLSRLSKKKELFNRLCQCEKDDWLSLHDWFWSSFMPPYERKYVDVKFGGKVTSSITIGRDEVVSGERMEEVNEEGNERRRESKDLASVTDDDRTPSKALKSTATSLTFMFVLLESMNTPKDGFDTVYGKTGNRGTKTVSFSSIFMDNTPKKTIQLSELSNEESVAGADVAIPLVAVDKWQPSRCDTCKIFDHIDDQCPKKVKIAAPTQESDDGFVEVTRMHGKGIQNGKPQHIDGVPLTKTQPNYLYRAVSKPVNVNDEASTSQPKENKEASSQPKSNANGKTSTSQPTENKEATSQSNAFSALEEDNGNPMYDLVDKARKKVEVPLKITPRKTSIWSGRKTYSPKRNVVFYPEKKVHYFDRDDMEFDDMGRAAEGWENENAYNDNGLWVSYGY